MNRDPLEEIGGINLFLFSFNNPVMAVDLFGLEGFWSNLYLRFKAFVRSAAEKLLPFPVGPITVAETGLSLAENLPIIAGRQAQLEADLAELNQVFQMLPQSGGPVPRRQCIEGSLIDLEEFDRRVQTWEASGSYDDWLNLIDLLRPTP